MGLLDSFLTQGTTPPNPDATFPQLLSSPMGQGLLGTIASYAANARRGAPVNSIGAGLLGGLSAYSNAGQEDLKRQYMQAQMANFQSEMDARGVEAKVKQAQLDATTKKQAALPTLFSPGGFTGGEPVPQSEGGVPMFSRPMGAAPVQAQPAGLNVRAALQAGYTPDEITKLDALRNVGLNKVARTIKATGPDGREYEYQVDDFGRPVGTPMAQYRAPLNVNQGNKTTYIDPYTLKPVQSFQTFQSPDSAASVAATIRGQNMTDARAREANANSRIPSGYRSTAEGGLEYIPGGPADPNAAKKAAPTEFQGKSTTFGARMTDAAKVIDELDGKVWPSTVARAGYKPEFPAWMPGGQVLGGAVSGVNRLMTPADAQRYYQAQENWVTANLRQESGAAIGKDEMAKDIAKWFPQPGDSEALIKQKAAARKVAERAMVVQAGPGAASIQGIVDGSAAPAATASAAPSGGPDWKYVNGKLVKVK
jgi:hypothetical protein